MEKLLLPSHLTSASPKRRTETLCARQRRGIFYAVQVSGCAQVAAVFLVFVTAIFCRAQTDTMVVPPDAADRFGNANSELFRSAINYQVGYDGSLFSASQPILITGLGIRVDDLTKFSLDPVVPSLQIWASTFRGHPEQMTLGISANRGNDRALVYSSSDVITGPDVHTGAAFINDPHTFQVQLQLSHPFVFDPNAGTLLLEIVAAQPTGGPGGSVDADERLDHKIATVVNVGLVQKIYVGEVLQVSYEAVPEPSVGSIVLLGSTLVLVKMRRTRV